MLNVTCGLTEVRKEAKCGVTITVLTFGSYICSTKRHEYNCKQSLSPHDGGALKWSYSSQQRQFERSEGITLPWANLGTFMGTIIIPSWENLVNLPKCESNHKSYTFDLTLGFDFLIYQCRTCQNQAKLGIWARPFKLLVSKKSLQLRDLIYSSCFIFKIKKKNFIGENNKEMFDLEYILRDLLWWHD